MAVTALGVTSILSKYFNEGDRKVGLAAFRDELAAMSPEEKRELADGVLALADEVKAQYGLAGVTEVKA